MMYQSKLYHNIISKLIYVKETSKMGMDGLSFANTGAIKEQTSAEYTNKVEQAIASDPRSSAQVQEQERIQQKEDEDGSNGGKGNQNLEQEFQDGMVEEEQQENENNFDVEEFENPNKEFYVKLNINDDIIELYESSSDRLIETISGSELGSLVNKLNMASGIFINKKV